MLVIRQEKLNSIMLFRFLDFKLLPLYFIFFAEILVNFEKNYSSLLKVIAVLFMIIIILVKKNSKINFLYIQLLIIVLLLYSYKIYNLEAYLTEFFRYLFPMIFLLYSYTLRTESIKVVKLFLTYVIFNDIAQVILYILFFITGDVYFANHFDFGLILRASGLMEAMTSFAFLNVVAFLIAYFFQYNLLKKIFFLFILLSFSLKMLIFILIFFMLKLSIKSLLPGFFILTSTLFLFQPYFNDFIYVFSQKIELYLLTFESARAQSYLVMIKYLNDNLFIGEGIGSFGGPSSVIYNSPIYDKYNFQWFDMTNISTTDTFYPHLVVETGVIFTFLYLALFFLPLIINSKVVNPKNKSLIIYIIVALFVDSFMSYGLNSPTYLISVILIYPLMYFNTIESYNSIRKKA